VQPDLQEATEPHPHARAILLAGAPPQGLPSHAYLFHGPAGTGKRAAARAFATALLTDGAPAPDLAAARVARGAHPDLTWVVPSGASELLVSDIDEPVVAAATRTPFEATRRVFVIESAGTMNDQAANRLLKTLEEPPSFVHLILLAEHCNDVLPTIASRCQQVRFDPLASELVERRLRSSLGEAVEPSTASACARLCGGDAALAERLAGEQGATLRGCAQALAGSALAGGVDRSAWRELLDAAKQAGQEAGQSVLEQLQAQAQLLPVKERRKHEREGADAVRRAERRARAATLDLGLRLAELWLRDLWCVAIGAEDLVLAVDSLAQLREQAAERTPDSLRRGVELAAETRLSLSLNVSEELALEALLYGLQAECA
jgi:DNA polymerase III subunit delta'